MKNLVFCVLFLTLAACSRMGPASGGGSGTAEAIAPTNQPPRTPVSTQGVTAPLAPVAPVAPAAPVTSVGGGSSTGGGHVRVCLTPDAARKVKANLLENASVPQIAMDPFTGVRPEEILSVHTLDLLERRPNQNYVANVLKDIVSKLTPEDIARRDLERSPTPVPFIQLVQVSLMDINTRLLNTGAEAFKQDSTNKIGQPIFDVASNIEWIASDSGLRLTSDFDPKVTNTENCIFAQAVRQTLFSKRVASIDYDEKLLARMSKEDLVVLGLHEAVYNAVLHSPNYKQIVNPSVTTRQLTMALMLGLSTEINAWSEFAEMMEEIGYGPYPSMTRPTHQRDEP